MNGNQNKISAGGMIILLCVVLNTAILELGYISNAAWYKAFYVTFPLLVISILLFSRKLR